MHAFRFPKLTVWLNMELVCKIELHLLVLLTNIIFKGGFRYLYFLEPKSANSSVYFQHQYTCTPFRLSKQAIIYVKLTFCQRCKKEWLFVICKALVSLDVAGKTSIHLLTIMAHGLVIMQSQERTQIATFHHHPQKVIHCG